MARGRGLYEVSQVPAVTAEIRALGRRAQHLGIVPEFAKAVRRIVEQLQTRPLRWGEPVYHPRKKGSTVCRGIQNPLYVQYAVFEAERKVLILKLKPVPRSKLAAED